MSALVELEDVVLRFGPKTVLDGVSLQVSPGERLVVMGQSGGGKSTLLRLILGILKPTSGRVIFDGTEISRLPRRQLNEMRQRIGMVYQYSALISSLTVRENLALPLEELTDTPADEIDEKIRSMLTAVDMEGSEDKLPAELSGGMRKRIGLARALVMQPELMLYDEPSAGLDPVVSSVIDELIIRTSEENQSAGIIVTHEMDSAFRIGTRMAMLYQGRIIADDVPEKFRQSTNPVVAQFVSGSTEGPIGEGRTAP
ncbi:MAG: ATP-binding cassette domain-containing protein [Verrucomicrobia bacterium]|nr:ATP-binding cassette domain-containing protein [Verrucomicrobiota bacterium]